MSDLEKIEIDVGNDDIFRATFELINDPPNERPGIFLDINVAACRTLGHTREELLRLSLKDINTPDGYSHFLNHYLNELKASHHVIFKTTYLSKSGKHILMEIRARFFSHENRHFIIIAGRDLAEVKQIEESLRESEEKFRILATLAPIGIYIIDHEFKCQYVNPKWCDMACMSAEKALGDGWMSNIHPDDRNDFFSNWQKVVDSEGLVGHEYRFQTSDGKITWVNGLVTARMDASGWIFQYVGITIDMTERKKSEIGRKEIEAQLFHSSKLASIGTLAAGVAHEINNPLTVVIGHAGIMEQKCKDVCKQGNPIQLQKILSAATRISKIVNGLRTYARPDTGTIEDVDMHLCINETLSLVRGLYVKDHIRIETDFNALDASVRGNSGKFQQVIMNIVGNAKDALKGCENALIGITTQDDDGNLLIEILDNGPGIPKNILPKIFDPFFTTKPSGKGTGLGLSICHTIIESAGGKISVESEEGIGTSFKIFFPRNQNRS